MCIQNIENDDIRTFGSLIRRSVRSEKKPSWRPCPSIRPSNLLSIWKLNGQIFTNFSVVGACKMLKSKHEFGKNRLIDSRTFLRV